MLSWSDRTKNPAVRSPGFLIWRRAIPLRILSPCSVDPPSPVRSVLLAFAVVAAAASGATAQPAERPITSLDYEARLQAPSIRLRGMGGLGLAVRDEFTELNLWDFAGIGSGLRNDRDSTSLDFWYEHDAITLDRSSGGVDEEFARPRANTLGLETAIRGSGLVVGIDAGLLGNTVAEPYAAGAHRTVKQAMPVTVVNAAGDFFGPMQWGLRGVLGRMNHEQRFWTSTVEDGRVSIAPDGERLSEPNFFTLTDGHTSMSGIGGSLSYDPARYGQIGGYLDYRRDKISASQDDTRNIYEESEPRQTFGYGAAAIALPTDGVQVGLHAGRETYDSEQEYRFTISGGSVDDPLTSRGPRLARDVRRDFLRVRGQGDLRSVPLTIGAAVRVAYERGIRSAATGEGNYNDFVLDVVANDTLIAPPLVDDSIAEVRTLEWGGGASYRLLDSRALVGAEYRWARDAIDATAALRRAVGWEVRAGGEYRFSPAWIGRLGWQHRAFDEDDSEELDEYVVDRLTAGVGSYLGKWRLDLGGHLEWWRTDFPDPGEAGGDGLGFSASLGREF